VRVTRASYNPRKLLSCKDLGDSGMGLKPIFFSSEIYLDRKALWVLDIALAPMCPQGQP